MKLEVGKKYILNKERCVKFNKNNHSNWYYDQHHLFGTIVTIEKIIHDNGVYLEEEKYDCNKMKWAWTKDLFDPIGNKYKKLKEAL